ncbi:MAG: hypothetical protein HYX46_09450 [Betaproteobacteria bacterium]|nr:hypothetical protein [Betaproteobacteria bacterium]
MVKWMMSLLFMFSSGTALAQGADVGLVNMVSGDVSFAPLSGAPGKVRAFMKVRDGDRRSRAGRVLRRRAPGALGRPGKLQGRQDGRRSHFRQAG